MKPRIVSPSKLQEGRAAYCGVLRAQWGSAWALRLLVENMPSNALSINYLYQYDKASYTKGGHHLRSKSDVELAVRVKVDLVVFPMFQFHGITCPTKNKWLFMLFLKWKLVICSMVK